MRFRPKCVGCKLDKKCFLQEHSQVERCGDHLTLEQVEAYFKHMIGTCNHANKSRKG